MNKYNDYTLEITRDEYYQLLQERKNEPTLKSLLSEYNVKYVLVKTNRAAKMVHFVPFCNKNANYHILRQGILVPNNVDEAGKREFGNCIYAFPVCTKRTYGYRTSGSSYYLFNPGSAYYHVCIASIPEETEKIGTACLHRNVELNNITHNFSFELKWVPDRNGTIYINNYTYADYSTYNISTLNLKRMMEFCGLNSYNEELVRRLDSIPANNRYLALNIDNIINEYFGN